MVDEWKSRRDAWNEAQKVENERVREQKQAEKKAKEDLLKQRQQEKKSCRFDAPSWSNISDNLDDGCVSYYVLFVMFQ